MKQKREIQKRTVTTKEAAEYIGMSDKTLSRWRKQGKGPIFLNVEGNYVYRISDLEAYLDRCMVHPEECVA